MTSNQVIVLMLGWLLFGHSIQRNYTEIYNDYCTDEILTQIDISEAERIEMRNSQVGPYITVNSIVDVIDNHSISQIVKDAGVYIILLIILTVFCLISFIVYLCFCCCCDRAQSSSATKANIYIIITLIFIVTSIALFIALIVFLVKLNTNRGATSCSLASVPKELLDGVNTPEQKFLGFNNLISILTSFKNELGNISTLANDFDQIANKGLTTSSKAALNSLSTFSNTFKERTTTDGTGAQAKPLTVTTLTDKVNDAISTEFAIYDEVATKITNAAVAGKQFAQNINVASIQNSLSTIITQFTDLSTKVSDVFGEVVTGVDYYNQYAPIGYWLTFGFGLLILILGVIAVIFVCIMIRRHTDQRRMGVKFCLSFSSFFIFLLGIIAIALLVSTISINSVCHAIGEVLSAKDVGAQIQSYGFEIDDFVIKVINECLPADSSGDVTNLISVDTGVFNQSKVLIDGLAIYEELKTNLTKTGAESPSITATVDVWQKFSTSIFPDHQNTLVTLNSLNNLISCSSQSFQLNANNCTSSGCQGIYDSTGFTAPGCSSNSAEASTLYNRLKTFTNDEKQLVGEMIVGLSGTSPNTPLSLNKDLKVKINETISSFENIKSKLQNTITQVSAFKDGLAANLNCTILRREMNNLESSFCFNFNRNLHYFAVLMIFIVLFMFFYSWCLCCSLRYMPTQEAISMPKNEESNGGLYMNNDERVPMY